MAALTRPFGFEGARKLEAADKLIAELEQIAHLVPPLSIWTMLFPTHM